MIRRFSPFNLKRIRLDGGYSRMTVALALGVHENTVRDWERGRSVPRPARLLALADLLACDLNELFEEVVVDA